MDIMALMAKYEVMDILITCACTYNFVATLTIYEDSCSNSTLIKKQIMEVTSFGPLELFYQGGAYSLNKWFDALGGGVVSHQSKTFTRRNSHISYDVLC